jgi:hypothetical protein
MPGPMLPLWLRRLPFGRVLGLKNSSIRDLLGFRLPWLGRLPCGKALGVKKSASPIDPVTISQLCCLPCGKALKV